MKFVKKAKYDYQSNGVNEENGYIKWFSDPKIKKTVNTVNIYLRTFTWAVLFVISRKFKSCFTESSFWDIVIFAVAVLLSLLTVGFYLRRILQLAVLSKGKLDNSCVFPLKWDDWATYNGNISRTQAVVSLVLPLIIFLIAFSAAAFFTNGLISVFFIFMAVILVTICGSDILMLFFCLKKLKKDDIIFGEYVRR